MATLPLRKFVWNTPVSQKWYAENGSKFGCLENLLLFFKQLIERCRYSGYTVSDPKCKFKKKASKTKALRLFEETAVETVERCQVLGSVLGNEKVHATFTLTTARKYANFSEKIKY